MPMISDEEAALAVKALEHYHAYLVATSREDGQYQALADSLKRKGVERESTITESKARKKA
jgi:hypothetical protein